MPTCNIYLLSIVLLASTFSRIGFSGSWNLCFYDKGIDTPNRVKLTDTEYRFKKQIDGWSCEVSRVFKFGDYESREFKCKKGKEEISVLNDIDKSKISTHKKLGTSTPVMSLLLNGKPVYLDYDYKK